MGIELCPSAGQQVTHTGFAEIGGAAGLLIPRLAPAAASGLALLLLAVYPANIRAAQQSLTIGGEPATPLVLRSVLQVLFIAAVLTAGFARPIARRFAARVERPSAR